MPLGSPIDSIKGVGDKRRETLKKMGIETVSDILFHAPFSYREISKPKRLADVNHGDEAVIRAEVTSKPSLFRKGRAFSIVSFGISDGHSTGKCVYYNQPYMAKNINKGDEYIFLGKVDAKRGVKQLQNPVLEKLDGELPPVYCTYKLVKGITQKPFKRLIERVLTQELGNITEVLPSGFRRRYNLPEINYTFQNLHFPNSMQAALDSKYRLSFEEMLLFMTALVNVKKENSKLPSESFIVNRDVIDKYISSFDFNLTGAQKKVINEILNDMQKPVMMNRLLQGDVGSGKTIPASVAMLVAKENGKQSALMAPTDILASQHYENIQKYIEPFGVKVALLKSRMPQAEKREILKRIKSGEIHAVIGTHALIQKSVEYNNLGMVVTDEQHRFGVAQRARISAKGNNPDTLVMSATPVPRTLALILYGDLDISIIDEMPKGRLPVKTRIIDEKKRMDMYAYIKEHLQKDNRAYIVCPLIEESDKLDVKSTEELVVELKRNIFKDIPVEVLHGKMKNEEKESIMQKFRSGKIKCLISTTVIEVGVDVPEASFMVIENAERFGLAQLHQLRGRVGRGSRESWCFLVTESEGVEAKKRLKIMTKSNDGFVIAEEDLKMRGPGQFMGFSQSGMMDPRVINLMGDYKLLAKVKDAMEELTQPKYADEAKIIRAEAMKRYEEKLRDIILN